MRNLLRPVRDLVYLLYPHLCLACGRNAPPYGQDICTPCKATLPESNFHHQKVNPFTEKFWGRLHLQTGAALYLFTKKGKVAQLIHNFKYQGKKEIGTALGRRYGHALNRAEHFREIDCIVPVPLHWKKLRHRGFNQSEMFANGLSESMGVPVIKDGLERLSFTSTQTKKSKLGRLENMEGVFAVKKPKRLEGKHILLVDDVLTTGSTLEACGIELLKVPGAKLSMVTIAMAVN
ncbi:MAG TPA: ComF family protein [Bacteroidetes bacterium]|nr:ComF family protein [Bacteroidota bacterium]